MNNKKAQEEIVGFVLIVVIIAIVAVIILGIVIRQTPSSSQESKDIYQFLESIMEYTTTCSVSYEPDYLILSELIFECHEGISKCLSNEDPCNSLNKTLTSLLDNSFLVTEESALKGYEFKSFYTTNSTEKEVILLRKGNCKETAQKGSEILIAAYPGTISNTLRLCY